MKRFLTDYKEVQAGLSLRADGSMKVLPSNANEHNRTVFFEKNSIPGNRVFSAEIVHGSVVEVVGEDSPSLLLGADALVTREENIVLAITVADCIPVYFYDSKEEIVGIAHAGWRGIVAGIIPNTLREIMALGGNRGNIQVALGPGINLCHFEIGEDVLACFLQYQQFVQKREEKWFVDLKGIIMEQLIVNGVQSENIENDVDCTFEDEEQYFSFRRDKTNPVEAMIAIIGMKKRPI